MFHFANGLWTLGITWGLWTSPAAMRRANLVSIVVGVGLAAAGLGALGTMATVDQKQARAVEERMLEVERMLDVKPPQPASPKRTPSVEAPGSQRVRPASTPRQDGKGGI